MMLSCQGGLFMVGTQYLLWAQLSDLMAWPTSTILHLSTPPVFSNIPITCLDLSWTCKRIMNIQLVHVVPPTNTPLLLIKWREISDGGRWVGPMHERIYHLCIKQKQVQWIPDLSSFPALTSTKVSERTTHPLPLPCAPPSPCSVY